MSDLFHENVPVEFIERVFDVMSRAHWHHFQILTKRSERLLDLSGQLTWPPNVWMGVSIESQEFVKRVRHLARVGAAVRFLSVEPLLGPITSLPLSNIGWVIVGGESGPRARPMELEWARSVRDLCLRAGVPFFLGSSQGSVQLWPV